MSSGIKYIAVLGATGIQGSSVVDSFLADPQWGIRAITRKASSEKARALADLSDRIKVVEADTADVESLVRAFSDCTVVFAMTDYWAPFFDQDLRKKHATGPNPGEAFRIWAYEDEIRHGKNIVDAAAKMGDGLTHLILSGLPSPKKYSHGKYSGIYHFESKAVFTNYVYDVYPELAKKMSVIYISFYVSNILLSAQMRPVKVGLLSPRLNYSLTHFNAAFRWLLSRPATLPGRRQTSIHHHASGYRSIRQSPDGVRARQDSSGVHRHALLVRDGSAVG